MTLIVEDGSGIAGAESYATTAFIDAYWAARTHNPLSTTWAAVSNTTAKKEGAAREASAYIDATWAMRFKGKRRGYVQGLLWPRTEALDEQGYPLPDLPDCLPAAVAELAARAVSATLTQDVKAGGGVVQRVKAGSVEVDYDTTKWGTEKSYPFIERMLTEILWLNTAWCFT